MAGSPAFVRTGSTRLRDAEAPTDHWPVENGTSLESAERRMIFEALHATGGHRRRGRTGWASRAAP